MGAWGVFGAWGERESGVKMMYVRDLVHISHKSDAWELQCECLNVSSRVNSLAPLCADELHSYLPLSGSDFVSSASP